MSATANKEDVLPEPERPALARTLAALFEVPLSSAERCQVEYLSNSGLQLFGTTAASFRWRVSTTRDALERAELVGLVPVGWTADPLRDLSKLSTHGLVLVLSLGRQAIETAEELGREVCRELRDFGVPQASCVEWIAPSERHSFHHVWERHSFHHVWAGEGHALSCRGVLRHHGTGYAVYESRAARRLWDLGIRLRWITPTGVSLGVPQVRERSARGAWEAFRD